MKKNRLLAASLLTTALGMPLAYAVPAAPAPATSFTADQKNEIQNIIHDYLVKLNPEVLMEASDALQIKQQVLMQAQAKSAIEKAGAELVRGDLTVAGNLKGNVTLVEFFDYNCSHCANMEPIIKKLIENNPKLRVVFKEFPIFGKESETASRFAIAAAMQGKYMPFQDKLFHAGKRIDETTLMDVAKKVGLKMHALKMDKDSKAVTDILDENRKLAERIHLQGTPVFILLATQHGQYQAGSEAVFIPGEASLDTLQDSITRLGKHNSSVKG